MLQKRYRLPSKLFKYMYDKGKKYRDEYGMLISLEYTGEITPKFGFVITKKIGNAPTRHRMTRVLRAIIQEVVVEMGLNDNGHVYEYIAFKFCDDYPTLKKSLYSLFNQALNSEKNNSGVN